MILKRKVRGLFHTADTALNVKNFVENFVFSYYEIVDKTAAAVYNEL